MRALLVAMFLLAGAHTARGDDLQRAKTLYEDGLRHYNVSEYGAAITAWKEAYLLSKRTLLLFNIGQAYRLSGDCVEAMKFYASYRREEPKPKPGLDAAIAACDKPVPPPDDRPMQPAQPAQPAKPAPVLEFGPIPRIVGTPPDRTKQLAGYLVGGVGILAGGAAIAFVVDSNRQNTKLDRFTGEWGSEQESIERRGRRDVVLAYTLGAAGAAAVITGATLLWLGRDRRELRVDVVPLRGGAAATWTVPF